MMYEKKGMVPSVFTTPNIDIINNNIERPLSTRARINMMNDVPTVILPRKFSDCSRMDLVILISRMLTSLIHMNDSSSTSALDNVNNLTKFHSKVPPGISVYNYLMRLTKYSSLDHCVLMAAVYYIDLLSSVYPTFTLNSLTVHRFLLTATTVASKGLCDSFCTNTHYAKVGGVHCSELNVLECELLRRINYRIIPRDDNIIWCKLESPNKQFVLDTQTGDEWNPFLTGLSGNKRNSGYNVLDIYYKKIVQLVGSLKSTQDKSRSVNYTFVDTPESTIIYNNERLKSSCVTNNGDATAIRNNSTDTDNKVSDFESQSVLEHMPSRKRNLDGDVYQNGNDSCRGATINRDDKQYDDDQQSSDIGNKRHINRQRNRF